MAKAKTSITTENRSGSAVDAAAKEQRTEMLLSDLHPFEGHPFKVLDDELMEQTVESIKQIGVVSPLIVRPDPEGGYEILSGHRRLHAAQLAGLETVPVIVKDVTDEQAMELALVENLQRRDLDFIEEAEGLARLMKTWGLSQEQAARKVGKSQSAVANKLRLLRLSPSVLAELRLHGLSERHARALLKLRSEDEQLRVVGQIVQGGWTVAKTEAYIESLLQPPAPPKREFGGFVLRDVRVFFNSVNRQLDLIRSAGVDAQSQRQETEREIVLTIRIPKREAVRR